MEDNYKYPFSWDFVDDSGNMISINQQGNGMSEEAVQSAIDSSLDTIMLSGEDLVYKLTVNGKNAGEIVIPKDQFLKNVSYNNETKSLDFIFETEDGEKNVSVNLEELMTAYESGDGIVIDGNKISIKISDNSEKYLSLSSDGIKLSGIDSALSSKANVGDSYTKDESDSRYITEHQDISGLATKDEVNEVKESLRDYALKEEIPSLEEYVTKDSISDMETKTSASETYQPKGDYALSNQIPSKVSELENDVPYLTEHQDISDLASKNDLQSLFELVNSLQGRIKNLEGRVVNSNELINALSSLTEGETAEIMLLDDISIDADDEHKIIIPKDATVNINLNNKTINFDKDDILFRVNGNLNIDGNGTIQGEGYVASANDGGVVNVNAGKYNNDTTCFQANGGTLNINSGYFQTHSEQYGTTYLLNHIDSKKNVGLIEVKGGTFVNYNPSDSHSENPPMNFVAEGYGVVESTDGDKVLYKVVKADTFENSEQLSNFISEMKNGESAYVELTNDVELDGALPMFINEGTTVTLDLNGKTLTNKVAGRAAIINDGSMVIKNGLIVNGNQSQQGGCAVLNRATMTIENGTFGSSEQRGAAVENKGNLTINGGTFSSLEKGADNSEGWAYVFINRGEGNPVMTINNANVDCNAHGMFSASTGTINVNGGNYRLGNKDLSTYYMCHVVDGTINLNGGTFDWTQGNSAMTSTYIEGNGAINIAENVSIKETFR